MNITSWLDYHKASCEMLNGRQSCACLLELPESQLCVVGRIVNECIFILTQSKNYTGKLFVKLLHINMSTNFNSCQFVIDLILPFNAIKHRYELNKTVNSRNIFLVFPLGKIW